MNEFVESLKRLYTENKITNKKLTAMLDEGKITHEEFDYIVGDIY